MKKAVIISMDKLPNGNAGAVRQQTLAKILSILGYETVIVGLGESTEYKLMNCDFFSYVSLRSSNASFFGKIGNIVFFRRRLEKFLVNNASSASVYIINDIPINAIQYIKKISKKNNAKLIHDSVEWYSQSQFKFRFFSYSYLRNSLLNRVLIDKHFSVIAISTYLCNYFKKRGNSVCLIPAVLDVSEYSIYKNVDPKKTVFTYAGFAGNKDYLIQFLRAASKLPNKEFVIRLIGITKQQLMKLGLDRLTLDSLQQNLEIHGKVSRTTVLTYISSTDFTIMFRDHNERYSKAGFPTKFTESMATGTPMILNLSSDIGKYVKDGREVIISSDHSEKEILKSLLRAVKLTNDEKLKMKIAARSCAENNLDCRLYTNELASIL